MDLRATADEDLPEVLALEADPDLAPWIGVWSAAQHRDAISEPDQAHLTFAHRVWLDLPLPPITHGRCGSRAVRIPL